MSNVTLRYEGGADLSFRDGSGAKRKVLHGEEIEVDAETAAVLLATDPAVTVAVPRETPDGPPTKAELRARASALGLELPQRATNDAITAAITAEEQRLADEVAATAAEASSDGEGDQGGSTSADDPGAETPGEADTPPSSTGAITLGDLPDGAKAHG